VKINATTHYLWRAVDQHGDVLDIVVQSRRTAVEVVPLFVEFEAAVPHLRPARW